MFILLQSCDTDTPKCCYLRSCKSIVTDGGNPAQIELRAGQDERQREGVINVRANVGIKNNRNPGRRGHGEPGEQNKRANNQ